MVPDALLAVGPLIVSDPDDTEHRVLMVTPLSTIPPEEGQVVVMACAITLEPINNWWATNATRQNRQKLGKRLDNLNCQECDVMGQKLQK